MYLNIFTDYLLEFLLIVMALLSAYLGIWGNTTHPNQTGYKRLSVWGWIAVIVGMLTFIMSVINTISQKKEITSIKINQQKIIDRKTHEGITYLIKHIVDTSNPLDTVFKDLKDTARVKQYSKRNLLLDLNPFKSSYHHLNDPRTGKFDQPYYSYVANINYGEQQLMSIIEDYNAIVDTTTVNLITSIIDDPYFYNTYRLTHFKSRFEELNQNFNKDKSKILLSKQMDEHHHEYYPLFKELNEQKGYSINVSDIYFKPLFKTNKEKSGFDPLFSMFEETRVKDYYTFIDKIEKLAQHVKYNRRVKPKERLNQNELRKKLQEFVKRSKE